MTLGLLISTPVSTKHSGINWTGRAAPFFNEGVFSDLYHLKNISAPIYGEVTKYQSKLYGHL